MRIVYTAIVLLAGVAFSHRALLAAESGDSQIKVVEVSGAGVDIDSAKKDACREAVRQVVGAYVNSETRTENDELIEDKVISLSSGLVEKMETLKESKDDGLVRVRISATVRITKVLDSLKANNIAVAAVDGESLGAKLLTSRDQRKGEADLIGAALDGCPVKWFKASVVGEPKLGEKIEGENVPVFVTVKVEPNLDVFIASADKLDTALQATNRESGEFQCDGASCATTLTDCDAGEVKVNATSCLACSRVTAPLESIQHKFNGTDIRCVMFPVKFLGGGRRSTWKYYVLKADDATKLFSNVFGKGVPWRVTLLDKSSQEIAIKTGSLGVPPRYGDQRCTMGVGAAGFWGGTAVAPAFFYFSHSEDVRMAPSFTFDVGFDLGVEEVKTINSVTVGLE